MKDRTFAEEVLWRLNQLEADRFEPVFRAAWNRMAPHQGVTEKPPETPEGRLVWRMAFSQALAEIVDPHFDPRKVAGGRDERDAVVAAHKGGAT